MRYGGEARILKEWIVAYFKTVIVLTAETEEDLCDVRLPPRVYIGVYAGVYIGVYTGVYIGVYTPR
jgi:hypothetical protein